MSTAGSIVECPLCGYFSPNVTLQISHLRLVHSTDPLFNIVCGIGGCTSTFGAFAAYNSHVYRHHRDALGLERFPDMIPSVAPCVGEADTATFDTTVSDASTSGSTRVPEVVPVVPVSHSDPGPNPTTRAAKFLLHLREGRKVSEVALIDVIDTCNAMCMHVLNNFKQEIREKCTQANVDMEILEDILRREPPHLFEGVNTIYRFHKFCVDHFGCLVCF